MKPSPHYLQRLSAIDAERRICQAQQRLSLNMTERQSGWHDAGDSKTGAVARVMVIHYSSMVRLMLATAGSIAKSGAMMGFVAMHVGFVANLV